MPPKSSLLPITTFAFLNVVDAVQTWLVTRAGGLELMPVANLALSHGLLAFLAFKVVAVAVTVLLLLRFGYIKLLYPINVVMAIVCTIGTISLINAIQAGVVNLR